MGVKLVNKMTNEGLVLWTDGNRRSLIPMHNCRVIYDNITLDGKRWWEASACYEISREEVAVILNYFK